MASTVYASRRQRLSGPDRKLPRPARRNTKGSTSRRIVYNDGDVKYLQLGLTMTHLSASPELLAANRFPYTEELIIIVEPP